MRFGDVVPVRSEAELRELVSEPGPAAANKARSSLAEDHRQWLARSPFCLVVTADAAGSCDVSPKGDPPGFTFLLDDTTIVIPERTRNRRMDAFLNVLSNPHLGPIYLVPARTDTLRTTGRHTL